MGHLLTRGSPVHETGSEPQLVNNKMLLHTKKITNFCLLACKTFRYFPMTPPWKSKQFDSSSSDSWSQLGNTQLLQLKFQYDSVEFTVISVVDSMGCNV